MKGRIPTQAGPHSASGISSSRWRRFAAILTVALWWWWKARPSDLYLMEYTAMIIFGPLLVIVGIGFFCWLLFIVTSLLMPRYLAGGRVKQRRTQPS